jgi:two-component system, chemotaxis family, sensor kinase CheA
MAATEMETKIEQLSEALVFADISDLPALADIHTQLQAVHAWAEKEGILRAASFVKAAEGLVEQMVMGEASDPAGALALVGRVISAMQRLSQGNCAEDEVEFPVELSPSPAATQNAPKGENGIRSMVPTMPAYVDEAIFSEFLTRQDSGLEEMEEMILRLERERSEAALGELKRQIHTLKGESALLGMTDVERLCHSAEDGLLSSELGSMTDVLLGIKDWLRRTFDAYGGRGELPGPPNELMAQLQNKRANGKTEAPEPKPVPVAEVAADRLEAKPLSGDHDLLNDFVIEATEHLDNCDVHLLTLETEPDNQDGINAVFRAFHTIKGVAGFLALDDIQALSHEAENLLDQARKGGVVLQGPVMDVVFDAVDSLKRCVSHISRALASNSLLEPVSGVMALVQRLREITAQPPAAHAAPVTKPMPPGAPRLGETLLETDAVTPEGLERALSAQGAAILPRKTGQILVSESVVSSRQVNTALSLQNSDFPDKKVGEILVEMGAASPEEIELALNRQSAVKPEKLGEVLVRSGEASARDVAQALRTQREAAQSIVQVREAVKVDADRLDLLVDMIGELVIAESMVAQSPELKAHLSTDVGRHLSLLDKITRELQVMAMSLRMVPVRSIFQKMARLVRDLSKKTGKPVNFTMHGEETELDKTVVDKIGDPLVHMVRNSVDHGLEDTPEMRIQAGKPPMGNVTLRAFHMGGNIHIQVEDDGRGLNRDAILRKALERGLISESDNLSDREIWNLIFEPGFSTAKQVTEVSGRGVGMDVVKRNIESLRGQVDIQSEQGKGSVFTIRLPLTLAIIDGMVVRVGEERYIIPTLSIVISLRPDKQNLNTVVGRGETLKLQGKLVPVLRLHKLFGIPDAVTDLSDGTIIVLESEGSHVGLLVDEILGQQQIVIKSLGDTFKDTPGIASGAIMPDGLVGLILDVGGLMKLSEEA